MIMVALLLALLTIWVAGSTVLEFLEERREAPGWRRVDGVVTSSSIHEVPREGERGFYIGLDAEIRYRYEVDGVPYDGAHHFADGGQPGGRKVSREMLRHFPPGARIRLHYDPGHPGEAKLPPRELNVATQIGCIIVLVLLTIGAYAAAWM
jgi:hypothetical protein